MSDDQTPIIVDTFAGAGGWAAGMHYLGVDPARTIAVEWDEEAAATHEAAGFPTVVGDVAKIDPVEVTGGRPVDGFISSPPCQAFSTAGHGRGNRAVGALLERVHACRDGWVEPAPIILDLNDEDDGEQLDLFGNPTEAAAEEDHEPNLVDVSHDVRADLTLQPLRWIDALKPRWVACEQVPPALALWESIAYVLRGWGYSVWTGVLEAERYGVPQTRRRAVLLARRDGDPVAPPEPTHNAYDVRADDGGREADHRLLPWVSMAEALGWMPSPALRYHASRQDRATVRDVEEPAPTLAFGHAAADVRWVPKVQTTNVGGGNAEDGYTRYLRDVTLPSPTILTDVSSWRIFTEPPFDGDEPTIHAGGNGSDRRVGTRPRPADEPSPTVTGKGTAAWVPPKRDPAAVEYVQGSRSRATIRGGDEPAPTVLFGDSSNEVQWRERRNDQSGASPADEDWPLERPATTIAGRDLVGDPGANANRHNDSDKSRNDGIRVDVEQAACLQTFPRDWPWQGSRTSRYRQIGNAVPPLLAAHVLARLAPIDHDRSTR